MYDSPLSLQELCLDCICDQHSVIFEPTPLTATDYFYPCPESKYVFRDADVYLFNELSEKLFNKFNEKHMLNDSTVNLFSGRNTNLRKVNIDDSQVSYDGLRILRQHKVNELSCKHMRGISICNIIDCLNEYSLRNLTHLNVAHCTFIDMSRHSLMVQLTSLKNLKSLNVAYTEFNQQTLQMVCEDLKTLERIDISGTCIKCVKPLLLMRDRLISLVASDLLQINTMTSTIIELDSLRHLDISLIYEKFDSLQNPAICDILDNPEKLPNLISLDISGWRDLIPKATLEKYLESHGKLKFLGIVLNAAAFEPFLCEPSEPLDICVAGLGNEEQIRNALRKHFSRHHYVQKALYHLFQLTGSFTTSRSDIVELVLPAMRVHRFKFGVQMAATACLYNLTRGEISKQIHPNVLSQAVKLTLNAMEQFPKEYQLQKNGLLTLCSDRILQDVSFDRFRCARLVLDSLCEFDETNMNRMSVAICSILAAKISTAETSELGAQPAYMTKLLSMVRTRIQSKNSDITMKFTLSALWNLTDESEATCSVFLESGGANLFLEVLRVFRNDSAIETKVLGLLNNIAEVERLRGKLMQDALMGELFNLLKYQHIDVSYFAAGIVAHLASDGDSHWTIVEFQREKMLAELEEAVTGWGIPENEMVAYRSFKPFFPLLRIGVDYRVQLWAVWAVHHVCTKNPKRYCQMLREEKGTELLENMLLDPGCNQIVRYICIEILQTLEMITY